MIKQFRKSYGFTQKQFGEKFGIKERTVRWYEYLERNNKLPKTGKYLLLRAAMIKHGVENMKVKVYENNAKLIEQANREYSPENIMIESVLTEEPKPRSYKWLAVVLIILALVILW